MNNYAGIYRAAIADNVDPEERKRYRVRVSSVHADSIPIDALPWAELCVIGGKGFGDFPHFEVGDLVFIMFEGADRRFPVIMGGWLSYQGGPNDLPGELLGDYERTQKKWVRVDRAGNLIEMNPLPGEERIRLRSRQTTFDIQGQSGKIDLTSDVGITTSAPQVKIIGATGTTVESEELMLRVPFNPLNPIASGQGVIRSDVMFSLQSLIALNVGTYIPPPSFVPSVPLTTATVNVEATALVKLSSLAALQALAGTSISLTAGGSLSITTGTDVSIQSGGKVAIQSAGAVEINSAMATVTIAGNADLQIGGACNLNCTGATNVTTGANVSVQAAGNASVSTGGAATVSAGSSVSMTAGSSIALQAPSIMLQAGGSLTLQNSGLTTIGGAQIAIG